MSQGSAPQIAPPASLPIGKSLGYLLLIVGLVVVVFSRGMETLSYQYAGSAARELRLAEIEFTAEWDKKLDDAKGQEERKVRSERDEAREKLAKGEWKDLEVANNKASIQAAGRSMWFSFLFMIGNITVVLGLATVGFQSVGAERILCLCMLLVIIASIYMGGTAWIASVIAEIKAFFPYGVPGMR